MRNLTTTFTKNEILNIIVEEFEKAHRAATENNSDRNYWAEEALRDLLLKIKITDGKE